MPGLSSSSSASIKSPTEEKNTSESSKDIDPVANALDIRSLFRNYHLGRHGESYAS